MGTPCPLPSALHPGKLWPASPSLMTPPGDINLRALSPAFQGLRMQFLQCQRGPGSASHRPTEICSEHSEGDTWLDDFSVLCSLSLQPEPVAGPWGCPTDVGFVPKLTSPPSIQCYLKNCLSPRSQSSLAQWGPLQSVLPGRWYPAGGLEGKEDPSPTPGPHMPTSFFSRGGCGGPPTSRHSEA